jgi:hypothetical protein
VTATGLSPSARALVLGFDVVALGAARVIVVDRLLRAMERGCLGHGASNNWLRGTQQGLAGLDASALTARQPFPEYDGYFAQHDGCFLVSARAARHALIPMLRQLVGCPLALRRALSRCA